MKVTLRKRFLCLLLSLVLLVSNVPVAAFSAETEEPQAQTVVETEATTEGSSVPETEPEETELVTPENTEETTFPTTEPTEETVMVETVETAFREEANTGVTSGTLGEISWELDDTGTLTISGQGEMPDVSPYPWYDYRDQILRIVVEEGITVISANAFEYYDQLTAVELPVGLGEIGSYAFYDCDGLNDVVIPYTVGNIAYSAFRSCDALTQISFGHRADQILGISTNAFDNGWVNTVTVPDSENVNLTLSSIFYAASFETVSYTAISLADTVPSAEVGEPVQIRVAMEPAWAAPAWEAAIDESQSTAAASIDENGILTAGETGYVTVRATAKGDETLWDETQIRITPATAQVSGISLRCEGEIPNEVELGHSVQIIADVQPGNAANKAVIWELENGSGEAELTEDGMLTGLKPGTVTVYATSTDGTEIMASLVVEVMVYVDDIAIMIDRQEELTEIGLGQWHTLSYEIAPEDVSNGKITWSVEDGTGSAELCVSESMNQYLIRGKKTGTVTLTATARDGQALSVSRELTVVGEIGTYGVTGGDIYYNTATGAIVDSDDSVTSANIPGTINGTAITAIAPYAFADYSLNSWGLQTYSNSMLTSVTIPGSVTAIGEFAFYYSQAMTSLKLSVSGKLHTIGKSAFESCEALASNLILPESVRRIGEEAFYYCITVPSLVIPDGIEEIDNRAFYSLNALKNVTMPGDLNLTDKITVSNSLETLTLTGDRVISQPYFREDSYTSVAQWSVRRAKTVILSDTIRTVEPYAFYGQDTIETVTFGSDLEQIGEYAFHDCDGLRAVSLPAGVRSVGEKAFYYCKSLSEIEFAGGLESIGNWAFAWCENLRSVNLPQGPQTIGVEAFNECDGLETVILGEGTEYIDERAFAWCDNLRSVSLPQGLLSIGEEAFCLCENLVELNLPDTLTYIGKRVFEQCEKLQILDLSLVPSSIRQKQTELAPLTQVPPVLVTATGGQVELRWNLSDPEGNYGMDVDRVASIWGRGAGNNVVWILDAFSAGTVMLHAYDSYTGAHGSKLITVDTGVYIETGAYPGYLISGKTLQLKAMQMPEGTAADVTWVSSNTNVATVSGGKVTAKSVSQAMQVTITAIPRQGGDSASVTLWVVPKTTGVNIVKDGAVLNGTVMDLEMSMVSAVGLDARLEGMEDIRGFIWTSSDENVATVDTAGNVILHKPGTTVLTVKDIYGTAATMTLRVTYVDAAAKLTASAKLPAIGLQPGETARMQVAGAVVIGAEKLTFTSSNDAVAEVDAEGIITARGQGSAVLTAALTGDPLNRRAELKVTAISPQTETLVLRPEGAFRDLTMLTAWGEETDDAAQAAKYIVYLDQADVRQGINTTFTVWPDAWDSQGEALDPLTSGYKWASSDTKIAAVKANSQGGIDVMVKTTAAGACVITAVSTDLAKVERELEIHVRDFAPRLEATAFTVNSWLEEDIVSTALEESYGNSIVDIQLLDQNGDFTGFFNWAVDEGRLFLMANQPLDKGTRTLTLRLTCLDGNQYDYTLKVTVKNSAPSVSVKQSGKLNLFYSDAQAALTIQPKTGKVVGAELADTEDFVLTFDEIEGTAVLELSETYDPAVKPDTKATLLVFLEGYSQPVSKAITVATVTTAPKLKLSSASSTMSLLEPLSASFRILEQNGNVLPVTQEDVTVDGIDYSLNENLVCLLPAEGTSRTVTVRIQKENWNKAVTLTHKISVSEKLPAVVIGGKLTLNRTFPGQTAEVPVSVSLSNLTLGWFDTFEPTSAEAAKIWVDFDGENLTAEILDPEDRPKKGTYTFTSTPYLSDGTALAPVKVNVSVTSSAPKVKAVTGTMKLNKFLCGQETASTAFTVSDSKYTLAGFAELDDLMHDDVQLTFLDGVLYAELIREEAAVKKHSFSLTPILEDADGNQTVLESPMKIAVQVYRNEKITVTLASKGKLDAAVPGSAIVYTVKKISNAVDVLEEGDVALEGPDADLFDLEFREDGSFALKLRPGEAYYTNRTYKVRLVFLICGREVAAKDISFKVTQSALKITVPKTVTFFQSQRTPLRVNLALTSPEGAALDATRVTVNTQKSAALMTALQGDRIYVTVSDDGRSAQLTIPVAAAGRLTAGKSYPLVLDILPESCAEDKLSKPTQVKLTVKISR